MSIIKNAGTLSEIDLLRDVQYNDVCVINHTPSYYANNNPIYLYPAVGVTSFMRDIRRESGGYYGIYRKIPVVTDVTFYIDLRSYCKCELSLDRDYVSLYSV